MAHMELAVALSMIVAVTPASATSPEPTPTSGAPAASPGARYCLRVEPITGSLMQTVMCRTREQWAELGVDLDKEWPKEGVEVRS